MQTLEGARAAGLGQLIGSLEIGKRADIVIRSAEAAEMAPGVDPAHQLIAIGHGATADTVLVNGRVVLKSGRSTMLDECAVASDAHQSAKRVAQRLGLRPPSTYQWLSQIFRYRNPMPLEHQSFATIALHHTWKLVLCKPGSQNRSPRS
jgi:hypothetical protein